MIDRETVLHVAKLSKLQLTDEEVEMFSKQLGDILNFIEKLNELNTDNVKPFYELINQETPLRDDKSRKSLPREEALKNAPQQEDGFFVVPRVVG
ncbi:MAG: Asp-tRNA(Asn)/Glu-tRNA(Gln) amidotransferase GatCAB subunit C [Persephonella sp.]|nr:MAG: Asp-tRNA(Asn)/Glu-tRNA(Gln) amidotransferase GatCAB subunit C [Persephonella sp.]RUM62325.1 MAG: Asp-tRNA(Asn)/Glu-tRNA(Gln) amidotransferase GatCAB subunit C [Persephonella sp.]